MRTSRFILPASKRNAAEIFARSAAKQRETLHSSTTLSSDPISLDAWRRGNRATAKANEEAYETALEGFLSAFEQAYVMNYLILSAFCDGNPNFTARQAGHSLGTAGPSSIVTAAWDQHWEVLSNIEYDKTNVKVVLDLTSKHPIQVQTFDEASRKGSPALGELEKTIQQIWPQFKAKGNVNLVRTVTSDSIDKIKISLNDPVYGEEDGLIEAGYLMEDFEAISKHVRIEYELRIRGDSVHGDSWEDEPTVDEKDDYINPDDPAYEYRIGVRAKLILPIDFAQWMTRSTPETFNKALFYLYMEKAVWSSAHNGRDWPFRATDPKAARQRIEKYSKGVPGFQPRVNSRGWSVVKSGGPRKWPTAFTGARYEQFLKDLEVGLNAKLKAKTPEERAEADDVIKKARKKWQGHYLVLDWINDRAVRFSMEEKVEVGSLVGVVALDAETEYGWLELPTNSPKIASALGVIQKAVGAPMQSVAAQVRDNRYNKLPDNAGISDKQFKNINPNFGSYDLADAITYLTTGNSAAYRAQPILLKHLGGIDLVELTDNKHANEEIEMCIKVANALKWADDNFEFVAKSYSTQNEDVIHGWFRWIIETLGYFGNKEKTDGKYLLNNHTPSYDEELRKPAMSTRNKTSATIGSDDIVLPNIVPREGVFEAFMPHQTEAFAVIKELASNQILDVSAGGGKTVLLAADCLLSLKQGYKRPLILMPGDLIGQFIGEVQGMTAGKVNCVNLRLDAIDHILKVSNIQSAPEFIKWVQAFPPNTLFFSSPNQFALTRELFEDFDLPASYGLHEEYISQYAQLMAAIGFDVVHVDEAQFIKNDSASRSLGTTYILSRAKRKGLASGTLLNNTVLDIHGETQALNPAIFGPQDEFIETYAINRGILESPEKAKALREKLRRHAAVVTKTNKDWAYLLPDLEDHFVEVGMSEKQTAFYVKLMKDKLVEIQRKLDEIKLKSKDATDEELEERITVMLQTVLVEVEQFLLSPEDNATYVQWAEKPTGADLVSPKVAAVDKIIDEHLADKRKTGKILVYSDLTVGSRHLYKHSKHRSRSIHYTVGNKREAIRRFKEDASVRVMFCDAISMQVGHNLQVADTVIRIQNVWAPGSHEQSLKRMYRPDPRGKYNRKVVDLWWILTLTDKGKATLDTAKMARMVSKSISNAQVVNADDPAWSRVENAFGSLPLLSMNLELVFDTTREQCEPYFEGWRTLSGWQNEQNQDVRRKLGAKLEKMYNVDLMDDQNNVKDIPTFLKYALKPVKADKDIEGSKKVYAPWAPGAQPADEHDLDLVLVPSYELDEGEEIQPNTLVMTEFGPAKIKSVRDKTVRVQAYHGVILLSKEAVAVPSSKEGRDKLKAMFARLSQYALVPPGFKQPANKDVFPKAGKIAPPPSLEDDEEETPTKQAKTTDNTVTNEDAEEVRLMAAVVNGMPALLAGQTQGEVFSLLDGWVNSTKFVQIQFSNWKMAAAFLEAMEERFYVDPNHMARLKQGIVELKSANGMRVNRIPNANVVKNFFIATRKKLADVDDIAQAQPYWISINTKARLAFDVSAHAPSVIKWLSRYKATHAGVTISVNDGLWIKFFKTMQEAALEVKEAMAKLKGKAQFDVQSIKEELMGAQKLLKEMRLNTPKAKKE